MIEVNVKEARNKLKELLDRAEQGEKIFVSRHGKKVACLMPPETKAHLPSLKKFRESFAAKGEAMSDVLLRLRGEERY
ncbi:MAG: prevent-host-death family protein [uncultured bacterium]|nr:MAG: prevent-host-death family protein [uncultured bacterium]